MKVSIAMRHQLYYLRFLQQMLIHFQSMHCFYIGVCFKVFISFSGNLVYPKRICTVSPSIKVRLVSICPGPLDQLLSLFWEFPKVLQKQNSPSFSGNSKTFGISNKCRSGINLHSVLSNTTHGNRTLLTIKNNSFS